MAKMTMTAQRWDELTVLLKDEQRLQAEYPRVAEYLDMAEGLSGTGDDQVEAAFGLRFVHYMTGGSTVSPNPYWDIVEPLVFEHKGCQVINGGREGGSARLAFAQTILQAAYSYAIPSPTTIEWISSLSADLPIVELGAGRGYWAAQLSHAGIAVEAYDLEPPDKVKNVSFLGAAGQVDVWHPVGPLEELATRSRSKSYVLFLCWPPGWGNTMASEALLSFEASGGERLIYIGEPKGGATGDDVFFDTLSERWRLDSVEPQFVSWWTAKDSAQCWVRR
ncbi:hypothetical protein [Nonomuraea endophytica]|uniref:Uncharacterized protein n=1 Tax=Nonomuraea endophytica TaxID=714136 RepID=A0A7W8AF80_9ACTN|nr:hypothetical protein [Nonomuraea endophytica]MBB5085064.1 hypothetical protein [Nonomuraea endophytica]